MATRSVVVLSHLRRFSKNVGFENCDGVSKLLFTNVQNIVQRKRRESDKREGVEEGEGCGWATPLCSKNDSSYNNSK